jgi:glycopeptide antibiotics resistance protein
MTGSPWVYSGGVAVVAGAAAFVVLFAPLLAWQYRRYGAPSLARIVGFAGLSLYGAALVSYTWLPLPVGRDDLCTEPRIDPQLRPFRFLSDIAAEHLGGVGAYLSSTVVLQVVFNVLLFVPWGVIARRYFGASILVATVTGALASLVIEASQATGLWFLFECPYRVADIDDLITNIVGAFIGAVGAPLVLWWMPPRSTLAGHRAEARPITVWRRWASMFIEGAAAYAVVVGVAVAVRAGWLVAGGELTGNVVHRTGAAGPACAWLFVFAIPALRGAGSIGLRAVLLVPRWNSGRGTLARRLLRSSVVSVPWLLTAVFSSSVLNAIFWITAAVSVVSVPATKGHRALSGWVTGAQLYDVRAGRP